MLEELVEDPPPIGLGQWPSPLTMTDDQLRDALKDVRWRLTHLYYIMDKDGRMVLFAPNAVQWKFIDEIWFRNVVPKARQRGFSTVVQILMLDAALFEPDLRGAVITQDMPTSLRIFRDKIKYAYDRLPALIREMNPLTTDSKTELVLANNSSIYVATTTRGGTLQWLHVSEYGRICADEPDKATEIQTGSLPSVAQGGIIVIESTVEGNDGIFAAMTKKAIEVRELGRPLKKMEYKLHFASWWDAEEYETDPEGVVITAEDHAYFERMEGLIDAPISLRKRAWYVQTRDIEFGGDPEKMWSQYPTTLEEAFTVSTEGTWLAAQLSKARVERRIGIVPYNPSLPVNWFWDLGVNDDIAIWGHQEDGMRDCFVDYIEGSEEPYSYFVAEIQKRGYVWGKTFLPHDGDYRHPGAEHLKTPKDMLEDLGVRNIEIVERTPDLAGVGIPQLRAAFPFYWIDEERCKAGLVHLAGYRKTFNKSLQHFSSEPLKNGHQHAADAIRQHAQAKANGMLRHTIQQARNNRKRVSARAA